MIKTSVDDSILSPIQHYLCWICSDFYKADLTCIPLPTIKAQNIEVLLDKKKTVVYNSENRPQLEILEDTLKVIYALNQALYDRLALF